MCGVAGMAGIADEPLLRKMLAITRHRGPNDSGTYIAEGAISASRVALGNNRLSIIDLSAAGHQPMCNEEGTVWVAYNGEVYNFTELRQELLKDGHHFKSHTDTEVLVHLYEKHGAGMVHRLNGMFAFAIWDQETQELLLFRDRMGIKPLYYTTVGGRLYFASEIKALLACEEITVELDHNSLCEYLAFLYVPHPDSMFKGIYKLPPGHRLRWRNCEIHIDCYWNQSYGEYCQDSEDALAEQFRELLIAATRRQLISDVPVGFFLSGGLDSSTLVACAAHSGQSSLKCYSIAYKQEYVGTEQCTDDARYAQVVAKHFGAQFEQIVVDPDVVSLLPRVVWHLDDPVADPAAIATYLISQAAAPEVTVLVSGQGADEVLAGYRAHRAHRIAAWAKLLPRQVRERTVPALLKRISLRKHGMVGIPQGLVLAACRYSDKLFRTAGMEPPEQYAACRAYLLDEDVRQLLSSDVNADTADWSYRNTFLELFAKVAGEDYVNQMLYVDAKTFLPDLNLAYSDKLSMACSIEVRVPFLDNEVIEFLQRVPASLKLNGRNQKYLLRKAMNGILPKGVLRRRKAAFGLPVRSWLRNELKEMLGDMLAEQRIRRRGLFNPKTVSNMIRDNENGERDYTLQLWGLLTLELWYQIFAEQRSAVTKERVPALL
jgi:asparagine synthase (glutamine-hydrolysing)